MAGELRDRLVWPGPKRILSLHGEGARLMATLGLLHEMERRLGRRSGRASFRLCHYFDLIGGSSHAAAIAAFLGAGRRVAEAGQALKEVYGRAGPGQDDVQAKLETAVERALGGVRLDQDLKCGVLFPVKPADGPLHFLHNVPTAVDAAPSATLSEAFRASIGSPDPGAHRRVRVGGEEHAYAAAAVFGAADPALLLLQAATMPNFGLQWPTGPDQLMQISVGFGDWAPREAGDAGEALLLEGRRQTLTTIQALAHSPAFWSSGAAPETNRAQLSPVPNLLFLRLDVRLEQDRLTELGLTLSDADVGAMRAGANDATTMARLYEAGLRSAQDVLGRAPGEKAVFQARFDPQLFQQRPLGPPKIRLQALGRMFEPPENL